MRGHCFSAIVVIGFSLLSACTPQDKTGQPPSSAKAPATTMSSGVRPTRAPTVERLGDVKKLVGKACSVLTANQVVKLGYPGTGTTDPEPKGLNCHWTDHGPTAELTVTLVVGSNALADAYQAPAVDYAYFLPYEVEGMPAVLRARRAGGSTCGAVVGVAADQALVVEYQESVPTDQACNRASAAAAAMAVNVLR